MRAVLALTTLVGALACSQKTSPATCATEATMAPQESPIEVSFRRDVLPALQGSCAFRSCHGGNRPPVLGEGAGDAAAIRAALLAPSETVPTMALVVAGDPSRSFLLHKLDGTLCDLAPQCVGGDCGEPMPQDADLLPPETRARIRAWIAAGAKDD